MALVPISMAFPLWALSREQRNVFYALCSISGYLNHVSMAPHTYTHHLRIFTPLYSEGVRARSPRIWWHNGGRFTEDTVDPCQWFWVKNTLIISYVLLWFLFNLREFMDRRPDDFPSPNSTWKIVRGQSMIYFAEIFPFEAFFFY